MKRIFIFTLFITFSLLSFSQLKGISLSVSPYAEHTWWNKHTTLNNTTFWGVKAGFGFGPLFEMQAFYQKSLDVEAGLRMLDWKTTDNWADNMTQSYLDISRYGGEIKMNMLNSKYAAPFLTLGGGIQNIQYDLASSENPDVFLNLTENQIFGSLGLGTKFNLSNRVILSLEAKNTLFNANESSLYIRPDYDFGKNNTKLLNNWSGVASVGFYLGGINPNDKDIYNAYNEFKSQGISGFGFVIEPGVALAKFKDESLYSQHYFMGVSAGFDLTSLVGIRGFYYQATDNPDKLSLAFNNHLSMYGANIKAHLNEPLGVNPYLILGGGYLSTSDSYVNSLGIIGNQSRGFAMGGIGFEIPLSRDIALFGDINALITNKKGEDLSEVMSPKQVDVNTMYKAGLRFSLNKKTKSATSINTDEEDKSDKRYEVYLEKLKELESKKKRALKNKDYAKVVQVEEEIEFIQLSYIQGEKESSDSTEFDAEEREKLIREVIKELKENFIMPINVIIPTEKTDAPKQIVEQGDSATTSDKQEIQKQLNQLQEILDKQNSLLKDLLNDSADTKDNASNDKKARLDNTKSNKTNGDFKTEESITVEPVPYQTIIDVEYEENKSDISIIELQPIELEATDYFPIENLAEKPQMENITYYSSFRLSSVSALTALDYQKSLFYDFGMRLNWEILNSNFAFMPEIYLRSGEKSGIGGSLNLMYYSNLDLYKFKPYFGFGIGVSPSDISSLGTNTILGLAYHIKRTSLFMDYSIRNIFDQNRVAIGLKFEF